MGRAKRNPSLGRPGKRWVSPLALPILRCHFLCPEPDRRGGVYRISTGCSLPSSTLPSLPYRRRPNQCLPGPRLTEIGKTTCRERGDTLVRLAGGALP